MEVEWAIVDDLASRAPAAEDLVYLWHYLLNPCSRILRSFLAELARKLAYDAAKGVSASLRRWRELRHQGHMPSKRLKKAPCQSAWEGRHRPEPCSCRCALRTAGSKPERMFFRDEIFVH